MLNGDWRNSEPTWEYPTMSDLDVQIRRYLEAVAPPLTDDEIPSRVPRLPGLRPALIGALVVLLGMAVAVLPSLLPVPADQSYLSGSEPFDDWDVVVFLDDDITTTQRQTIERQAVDLSTVGTVRFFDRAATWQEFQVMFADNPAMLDNVDPDILPLSYRLDLHDPQDAETVMLDFADLPGVLDVALGPEQPSTSNWIVPLIAGVVMAVTLLSIWNWRHRPTRRATKP